MLIVFAMLTRFVVAKYLIKVSHKVRMTINSVNMALGLLIIALACTFNENEASFYISLLGSCIIGSVNAVGESTMLGLFKGFPKKIIGYFTSGQGFAGILASLIILVLQSVGLSDGIIFFSVFPIVFPYYFSFLWVSKMKAKHPYVELS